MTGGKKTGRGHFCWCCERILPNESFERFLAHSDPRVRKHAEELAAVDAEARCLIAAEHRQAEELTQENVWEPADESGEFSIDEDDALPF